jgi:hypothetical protein
MPSLAVRGGTPDREGMTDRSIRRPTTGTSTCATAMLEAVAGGHRAPVCVVIIALT